MVEGTVRRMENFWTKIKIAHRLSYPVRKRKHYALFRTFESFAHTLTREGRPETTPSGVCWDLSGEPAPRK